MECGRRMEYGMKWVGKAEEASGSKRRTEENQAGMPQKKKRATARMRKRRTERSVEGEEE